MAYKALYRTYRPQTFEEVAGQKHIIRTLKNALATNKIAHAYLFCGPRGTGKTTMAKLFAKALNCEEGLGHQCNHCSNCLEIIEGSHPDVIEIDAASNNGVEQVRELIDTVNYLSIKGKKKVYIIDEVHMMTTNAFNALLKTLEEPPEHVIFILATTEKHKILPTILSRCQIFDFNRIQVDDITNHLANVAGKEGITIEKDALNVIATKSAGGLRDALSIFDQIVSFSGKNVTYKDAIDNLNVLDYEYFFKLTDAFLVSDYTTALLTFDEILNKGFDEKNFLSGLSSHFRDLFVCKSPNSTRLLEVSTSAQQRYLQQTAKCSAEFLFTALEVLQKAEDRYRESNNKRLLVELTLLQLCNILKKKLM